MKFLSSSEHEVSIISKKPWIFLIVIAVIAFIVRMYYFPFDLPVSNDAIGYFWYANDLAVLGTFPSEFESSFARSEFPNNGWPSFLSVFFVISDSSYYLDYHNIQRFLGVIISTFTIIPIYLLAQKFLERPIALLSAALFIFSPRLIESSLLGTTETPFLFLGITSLYLFLSNKYRNILFAFLIAGLFALVRYEGLLIIIPFTIIYFLRFHKKRSEIGKYAILLFVFVLILLPMAYIRIETTGQDGLVSHVSSGPEYYQVMLNENNQDDDIILNFISKGITSLAQYIGLGLIPMFALFIPIGIFKFFKTKVEGKWALTLFSIIFLIPAFYAYSRGFEDTRYIFMLFPFFAIVAGYSLQTVQHYFNKKYFFIFLIIGIICFSFVFINYMIMDFAHEKELNQIAQDIAPQLTKINRDYDGLIYFSWTKQEIHNNFPIASVDIPKDSPGTIKNVRIGAGTDNTFDNLEDYLAFGKLHGMTEIILDGDNLDSKFLQDVFYNEKKYPYLIKIYDSKEHGFIHHVKVFEIDYDKMNFL